MRGLWMRPRHKPPGDTHIMSVQLRIMIIWWPHRGFREVTRGDKAPLVTFPLLANKPCL
jgi:hypothetical protein